MDYLLSILVFLSVDDELGPALHKKHSEIFKSNWYVALFRREKELLRPAMLNQKKAKRLIRAFLLNMSDMLLAFGFAGYYYVKDMVRWIEADPENAVNPVRLPFGVIPLRSKDYSWGGNSNTAFGDSLYGTYVRYTNTVTMEESIVFECSNEATNRLYGFGVFIDDPKFVNRTDGVGAPDQCGANGSMQRDTTYSNDVIPISPIYPLYRARSHIDEALSYEFDTGAQSSHPVRYLTAEPLPDTKVQNVTEEYFYSLDTILGAAQSQAIENQNYTLCATREIVHRMNQANNVCGGSRPRDLEREQRRLKYGRTQETQGIQPLPAYVNVANMHPARCDIDRLALQRRYEQAVCLTIRLPFLFFKGQASATSQGTGDSSRPGGTGNEAQLDFYRNELFDEVAAQHETMARIFSDVYDLTYRPLDIMTLEEGVKERIRKEKGESERIKKGGGGKGKKKGGEVMEVEGESALRRALVEATNQIEAGVFFEKIVTKTGSSIATLLQCYDRGLIPESYVAKHIYMVFGQEKDLI